MDQFLYDNEPLFSLFEDTNSGNSSNEYTPPHEPQIFGNINSFPLTTELSTQEVIPNSYTLDIPSLYKTELVKQVEEIPSSSCTKTKRKREKETNLEKLNKKPEFFNSPEEEKEWKKQRRMIRNRLSAQASREKKRDQLDYFQQANDVLQKNNDDLTKKVLDLSNQNESLHREIMILKSKLRQYEAPNQQLSQQQTQHTGKKAVVLFVFLFFIGLFFTTSKTKIELNSLNNNIGRVLLSTSETPKIVNTPQETPKISKNLEMKKEAIFYQSEIRDLFGLEKVKNETKELIPRDKDTEVKSKLEKGFIFHYENNEDTIYFMCPKLYPLFPDVRSTTTRKKSLNMTFLIPVESHVENEQTIVKLSKFSAKEIEKSEAFLKL